MTASIHQGVKRWVRVPLGEDQCVTLKPYCDFRPKGYDKAESPIKSRPTMILGYPQTPEMWAAAQAQQKVVDAYHEKVLRWRG